MAKKRNVKRPNTAKQLVGRVALGTTAAAAYLGVGTDADAAIVYFGAANSFSVSGVGNSAFWDIDGPSVGGSYTDFVFSATYNATLGFGLNVKNNGLKGRGFVQRIADGTNPRSFRNLTTGMTVGPTLPAGYQFATNVLRTATRAGTLKYAKGFASGVDGYIGFKFDGDSGPGEALRYGWARINITASNSASHEFKIQEWAYENTGSAIKVGAIPEPGSAALLGLGLLAGGVAGVRRWRREKNAAEKTG